MEFLHIANRHTNNKVQQSLPAVAATLPLSLQRACARRHVKCHV